MRQDKVPKMSDREKRHGVRKSGEDLNFDKNDVTRIKRYCHLGRGRRRRRGSKGGGRAR